MTTDEGRGGTWQAVACDLCRRRDSTETLTTRLDGARVAICRRCGVAFLDPRPSDDEISRYYAAGYFGGGDRVDGIGYQDYWSAPEQAVRRALDLQRLEIIEAASSASLPRTMLEVGSADGAFAGAAATAGWHVVAVDVTDDAARSNSDLHREVEFRVGSVEQVIGARDRFAVTCAFEVIEHVTSPMSFLRALREVTLPGGLVALSTPDLGEAYRVSLERWIGFQTSFEHLYFLDLVSIAAMADQADLEVIDWYGAGDGCAPSAEYPTVRRLLRKTLQRAHLLGAARRLRRRGLVSLPSYVRHTGGHNLLVLLRTRD